MPMPSSGSAISAMRSASFWAIHSDVSRTLGVAPAFVDGHRIFYRTKTGVFSVSKPINGEPATFAKSGR